jgi:hypothetical protein
MPFALLALLVAASAAAAAQVTSDGDSDRPAVPVDTDRLGDLPLQRLANSGSTTRRLQSSCADVTCAPAEVLIDDAGSTTGDATTCCICPAGTVTTYADEALAFRFRADGITRDANGSLAWNATTPSGLAFTTTRIWSEAMETTYGAYTDTAVAEPAIITNAEGAPSGLLFSYHPGNPDTIPPVAAGDPAVMLYSTHSVAIGVKNTMFWVFTPLAEGQERLAGTLLGFLEVEFAWYLGSLNGPGSVNADVWNANGFYGPTYQPGVTQIIISRSRYGEQLATPAGEGPVAELAVLDISTPSSTIEWSSVLYAGGIISYEVETDLSFDWDFRDPDVDSNRAFAAGHMMMGVHLPAFSDIFQLRGTMHHFELHADTLTAAQAGVVVRKLRHTVDPSSTLAVPACDVCEAGTQDSDLDPATACVPCGRGTFSNQVAMTQCVGTCEVGNTILSTGATSYAACTQCTCVCRGCLCL